MKNEDIHNNLDRKEIRDFLAKSIHKELLNGGSRDELYIKYLEDQIEKLKESLIHCKIYHAISALINSNGWKEFDISDEVYYDEKTYFPFIGTEEEYKTLTQKIVEDNHEQ